MTRTIALMRPASSLGESVRLAKEKGFYVLGAPVIELEAIANGQFNEFVESLSRGYVDYVVFTSANGLRFSLGLAEGFIGKDEFIVLLRRAKVVAIGAKTRQALSTAGVKVSHTPSTYSSEGLAHLFKRLSPKGSRIVLVRSAQGSGDLVPALEALGARVTDVQVYRVRMPGSLKDAQDLVKRAANGEVDVFCFTSAMTVLNFLDIARSLGLLDEVILKINRACVAAIGQPTVRALKSNGMDVDIVPEEQTFEALLDEVVRKG